MKRDPLFFRLFKELPGCFFQLVGRSEHDAERYALEAIEYKATSVRLDGLFRPLQPGDDPAYLWEVQFYTSEKVYANLLSKIGRFLEHGNPEQDWVAVVIYPNRELEQKNLHPYRCLLESDQLVRIYLNELPPVPPDQFEMGILELIAAKPEIAFEKARVMVPRLRQSNLPKADQRLVLQLIETVIVHQFPKWSREEIAKMLQVTDVTQTRVYQEGVEDGLVKGIEKGIESVAMRMIKMGRPVLEIAQATGLTPTQIRKLSKKVRK
ncbi:MAG TPA: Rpn family recombination-promoting nuclease/putative transposase [Gemmata sp.]|jgi:predicted transposase/invertase (TIGR01784 family)|nr:Rpn family recombination-promoting nuclease/putative transposase [Gemmata sp.]